MIVKILILSAMATPATFVRVIDIPDFTEKDNIRVKDYCPSTPETCGNKSHIVCTYNPNILDINEAGCLVTQPVQTMTKRLQTRILKELNGIRSKIALGTETGKNGINFPRGYGIFKIFWDEDLAALASLQARLCGKLISYCFATQKYSEPYPLSTSAIRPDYENITKTAEAVEETIESIILTDWYNNNKMRLEDPVKIPDFSYYNEIMYQNMVSGNVSHVGCGLTTFHSSKHGKLHSNVIVVCLLGQMVKRRQDFYFTEIPSGYSPRCGCPPGSPEEENTCFCITQEYMDNGEKDANKDEDKNIPIQSTDPTEIGIQSTDPTEIGIKSTDQTEIGIAESSILQYKMYSQLANYYSQFQRLFSHLLPGYTTPKRTPMKDHKRRRASNKPKKVYMQGLMYYIPQQLYEFLS